MIIAYLYPSQCLGDKTSDGHTIAFNSLVLCTITSYLEPDYVNRVERPESIGYME